MTSARIGYVALAVRDVDAVAGVLENSLGLRRVKDSDIAGGRPPVFGVGDAGLAVFDSDDPFLGGPVDPGLHHIGLVSDDPGGWAGATGLSAGADGLRPGSAGGSQLWLDAAETCGVRICVIPPISLPPSVGGLIERIDHLGVASSDNRRAVDVFAGAMGFPVESQQTDMEIRTVVESFTSDKYGVVYHSRPPVPVGGLRVTFINIGDCELEFLQNFDPSQSAEIEHGQPGTTKQDQGAITRFIARRGAGLHHLALKTTDIDAVLGTLADVGLRMIDLTGRPGSRRARIGFVHPAALGGVLLHFVERQDS